jgi:phosphatidylglycerol lysyltransferase
VSSDIRTNPDPADAGKDPLSDDLAIAETPRLLQQIKSILPLVFLVVVVVFAARELRELDVHAVRAALKALALPQLLLVQLVAVAGVLAMSLYDWYAARVFQIHLPLRTLARYSWIANTFNNFIGLSGLAGSGIRMLLLGTQQIETGRAAAFSAFIMASVPVGLAVSCWPLLLGGRDGIEQLPIPSWTAWLVLAAFATYLPVYIFTLNRGMFSRLLHGLSRQTAKSLFVMIAISTFDWLLAASAAWIAMKTAGTTIPLTHFYFAFVLASALGILSLLPGGLGVFDAALVTLLAPVSDSPEHLISGVILFRLCYYLVPWLIAIYIGADRLALPGYVQRFALVRQWRQSRLPSLLRIPFNVLASLGVRVLAYLTFAAGIVLLASSAFPTLKDRLAILHEHVPLAAVELSHLLSVVTGVLLIALSRGIAEQVRSAYHLTQILLISGALFSVLKGIDFEEAIILLTIAALLRQQRARFYRESYPLVSVRSLKWTLGLIASIAAFAWLGDWVHGDFSWGWEDLSRFAPALEAPRFARALLIAAMAATSFIGWSFYKRPQFVPASPDAQALSEAESVLNQYGGTEFAHLVFLGDKSLLWSSDRKAFIQYGSIRDRLIALGDPCGDPASFDSAIIAFRDLADLHDLTPCFYEVGEKNVHRYHDAGFALFKLGETATVRLAEFTLSGKRGEAVRHGVNRAKRDGARFELLTQPLGDQAWAELHRISDAWLLERNTAEKGFSLGNYNEAYLARTPIGVIKVGDQIVAFANVLPDYGSHTELSLDLMRHSPQAPPGTMDLLFAEFILYAKAQGYQFFNLGMAPLVGVGETRYARAGEKVARLAYEYGNRFYNYKGLRSFKEKFHPEWRSTYLAYPVLAPLPVLLIDSAALIAGGYRRIFLK